MEKPGRKAGKSQKKIAVESEGGVSTGIAEANNLNLDGKIAAIVQEIEGTPVKEMPPDAPVRMPLVVLELVAESLTVIGRRNFLLKRNILLEKGTVFH